MIDQTQDDRVADYVVDLPAAPGGGGGTATHDPGEGGGGGDGEPGGTGGDGGRRRFPIAAVSAGVVAVIVAAMFFVFAGADPVTNDEAKTPLMGKPAPQAVSTTTEGGSFDLARRRGSWVVLNFFQSTCVPCIREHPQLVEFAEQQAALGPAGVELYTVASPPDDDSAVADFFERNGGGEWTIVRDYDGAIGVDFGVSKFPETWVIDPNGLVRARIISEVTAAGLTETIGELQAAYAG